MTADANLSVFIGKGDMPQAILARYANRHGLVAGATGTGKTVTLQVLAEGFSELGVPVFAADIKGDLSGLAVAGEAKPRLVERAAQIGFTGYAPEATPVVFWDVFGRDGHPIRATVSDLGPLLLARLMALSEVQESVLTLTFKYADDHGLLLLDLKDLRAMLQHVAENAKAQGAEYGLVSAASVGAIQRGLVSLDQAGVQAFFGEPALELSDLMRTDLSGRGIVNVLAADQLFQSPRLYSTFLLWLLAELFETLPEAGDLDKPKLVFFFDEAHLLFNDAPKALIEKVEQVVRLIRSKGVGVYFVTQNPLDLPDAVLGQLGNRVQHALRAFTPRDQKAVKAAAETFRPNPPLNVAEAITELEVGEALVSTLMDKGIPSPVERTLIRPPKSRIGPLSPEERKLIMSRSPVASRYDSGVDRESAYEMLARRAAEAEAEAQARAPASQPGQDWQKQVDEAYGPARGAKTPARPRSSGTRRGDTVLEAATKSIARGVSGQIGREIGRQVLRGLFGAMKR